MESGLLHCTQCAAHTHPSALHHAHFRLICVWRYDACGNEPRFFAHGFAELQPIRGTFDALPLDMLLHRFAALVFASALVGLPIEARAARVVVVFHETLAAHGQWVVTSYGEAWCPAVAEVGVDFVPYASGGHWVYTDAGWVFETRWAWGWAPFHYGRWVLDPFYGWVWIPGVEWAPAWVEWRYGGGFVGWAPLGPPGVVWSVGVGPAWTFVGVHDFVRVDVDIVRVRIVDRTRISYAVAHTRQAPRAHAGGGVHVAGPAVREVSKASGVEIRARHVDRPARGVVRKATIHDETAGQVAGRARARVHEARQTPPRTQQAAKPADEDRRIVKRNQRQVRDNPAPAAKPAKPANPPPQGAHNKQPRLAEPTATPATRERGTPRQDERIAPEERRVPSSQAKRRQKKR
jgi:uncharacterized protein DUF6600